MDPSYDELWERAYEVWGGREHIAVMEELVRLADSNNDVDVAYSARRELIDAYNSEGLPEKSIVAFSWCLAEFDKDPELDDGSDLLWEYKVILELIPIFATVSREQIVSMQEDMARRLAEYGETERTAHYFRAWNFMRMGDYETALKHQERYTNMPRTSTSDCKACERDRQVELWSRMHRDREALKLAKPVMSGSLMCGEVPEFTNAHIVRSQLRLGKIDEAAERQKSGYAAVRNERKYLGTIGDLLLVLVRNRDLDHGLAQVTRHLPWAAETAAGELKFRFFSAVALFFEALHAARPRRKKIRIPKELGCWQEDDRYTPQELAQWFSAEAQKLADQFNARNDNAAYNDLLADNRELAGLE